MQLYNYLTLEVPEENQRAALREFAAIAGVDPREPGRKTLMNWDEIRSIAAHPLVSIGAHTVNHCNLARLPEERAKREMTDVVTLLQVRTRRGAQAHGLPLRLCQRGRLPRGQAGRRKRAMSSAVTTRHGVLRAEHADHLLALPRISVNGRYQRVAHIRTMLSGITTPLANRGRMLVTV